MNIVHDTFADAENQTETQWEILNMFSKVTQVV